MSGNDEVSVGDAAKVGQVCIVRYCFVIKKPVFDLITCITYEFSSFVLRHTLRKMKTS
jgi:hypothetical protein